MDAEKTTGTSVEHETNSEGESMIYANYKGKAFEAKLDPKDFSVIFQGERYKTPSAAAVKAKKGKSTNGWTFWTTKQGETIDDAFRKGKPKKAKAAKAPKVKASKVKAVKEAKEKKPRTVRRKKIEE